MWDSQSLKTFPEGNCFLSIYKQGSKFSFSDRDHYVLDDLLCQHWNWTISQMSLNTLTESHTGLVNDLSVGEGVNTIEEVDGSCQSVFSAFGCTERNVIDSMEHDGVDCPGISLPTTVLDEKNVILGTFDEWPTTKWTVRRPPSASRKFSFSQKQFFKMGTSKRDRGDETRKEGKKRAKKHGRGKQELRIKEEHEGDRSANSRNSSAEKSSNVLVDRENPVFFSKRARLSISLLPWSLRDCKQSVENSIRKMMLKYSKSLGGILMAYDDVHLEDRKEKKISEGKGWILNELPHIHYNVSCDVLVFSPSIGCEVRRNKLYLCEPILKYHVTKILKYLHIVRLKTKS